jgi:hypothetical protein
MPGSYAGSTYIGTQPMSFKRDPKGDFVDPEKQRWLEENELIPEDKLAHTKSGSTFMEVDLGDGRKSYVVRKNTDINRQDGGDGVYGDPSSGNVSYKWKGTDGKVNEKPVKVSSFKNEFGVDRPAVTMAKSYGNKRYTNAEFEEFSPRFKEEVERRQLKKEEDEAWAKKVKEANLGSQIRTTEADAGVKRELTLDKGKRENANNPLLQTAGEEKDRAGVSLYKKQTELAGSTIDEAAAEQTKKLERRRKNAERIELVKSGTDLDGISMGGEEAMRQAAGKGLSTDEIMAAGEKAHAEDVRMIEMLESSNIPINVRKAKAMRIADRDLANVRDFTTPRDLEGEQRVLKRGATSFIDTTAPKLKGGAWDHFTMNADRGYRYADTLDDTEKQTIKNSLTTAIDNIRQDKPFLTDEDIKEVFRLNFEAKNLPNGLKKMLMSFLEESI